MRYKKPKKVTNIMLACNKINGIVIHPGETFSYWKTVGMPKKKDGYKEGLVFILDGFGKGIGGGLCQMANMIHYLVLNSPLEVTELHHHSDAMFPDERRRVPFGTGTSVSWRNLDYRFKNDTDQPVQIVIWQDDETLYGELRSLHPYEHTWSVVEEDAGYVKENGVFYRISKVYQLCHGNDGNIIDRRLILNNHSRVLYDYDLIPEDQIISKNL